MSVDPEVWRELVALYRGTTWMSGEFDLATGAATSTSIARTGVSSNSVVLCVAKNSAAGTASISVVPAKDQFVITHAASGATRTFRYAVFTGIT